MLSRGTTLLASENIDTPALDAALLLVDIAGLTREKLYIADGTVTEEQYRRYLEALEQRRGGECVAHILGRKEFWGLDFKLTPAVLVPRPDTEILVEAALEKIHANPPVIPENHLALLDLCTGSGAVAIALKHECPDLEIWATDLSEEALTVARGNAEKLLPGPQEPAGGIRFLQGDLFSALKNTCPTGAESRGRFSIITANPPYIPSGKIPTLAIEVRREPRLALDGGEDGLDIIRHIIAEAPLYLEETGVLLLEADPSQMDRINTLLEERGFQNTEIYRDLAGQDRVIGGALP
jgi:release factor glutamine methyltransferase